MYFVECTFKHEEVLHLAFNAERSFSLSYNLLICQKLMEALVYLLGNIFIMPPTLKKWGTYWFWLVCVCVYVCVCIWHRDIGLKLYVWIPH